MPENDTPNPIFHPDAGAAIAGAVKKKKKTFNPWSWEEPPAPDAPTTNYLAQLAAFTAVQTQSPSATPAPETQHIFAAAPWVTEQNLNTGPPTPATLNSNPPPFPGAWWDGWQWRATDNTPGILWNGPTTIQPVQPWAAPIGGAGGNMPQAGVVMPLMPIPNLEPEPPEYDDDDAPFGNLYDDADDPDHGPDEEPGNENQHDNGGGLMPPSPHQQGPRTAPSKQSADTLSRTCQTCGNLGANDIMKQSSDKIWLCSRCYKQYRVCTCCGWTAPEKKFTVKTYTYMYCDDCGPKRKSKLHVRQQTTFEPKADVIRIRKEKVWPPISN